MDYNSFPLKIKENRLLISILRKNVLLFHRYEVLALSKRLLYLLNFSFPAG